MQRAYVARISFDGSHLDCRLSLTPMLHMYMCMLYASFHECSLRLWLFFHYHYHHLLLLLLLISFSWLLLFCIVVAFYFHLKAKHNSFGLPLLPLPLTHQSHLSFVRCELVRLTSDSTNAWQITVAGLVRLAFSLLPWVIEDTHI